MKEKQKELEELEYKYFMLQMADTWNSNDHKFAEELREKMEKIREEIAKEKEN